MSDPLVSVIIPVYNAEEYICECVDSVLNQTYTNIQIILVNDGSEDNSGRLIQHNYGDNPRIKYCNKENQGVSNARNTGLRMSSGEFITFLDSDDWVSRQFIEEAVRCVVSEDLDFVLGGTEKVYTGYSVKCAPQVDNGLAVYRENIHLFEKKVLSNGVVGDALLDACFTSGPVCKLFRRETISGIEFDEHLSIGEDTVYNLSVLQKTRCAGILPRVWYYYRMNSASATRRYNPEIVNDTKRLLAVLQKMYGNKEEYIPYLTVRYAQQFHGVLYLYPLSGKAKMNLSGKYNFIKTSLNDELWKPMVQYHPIGRLPIKQFDKLLLIACSKKYIILMILLVKLRIILKEIMKR